MQIVLKYLFVIVGTGFSFYALYLCVVRYLKIKDLPNDVIGKFDRENYLKNLIKYCIICTVGTFLSIVSLFSPILELKSIIPIMSIIICSYVLQNLFDEIDDFDISKKDADIIKDYLNKSKKSAKDKEKTNKIIKIDSSEDASDIINNEKNKKNNI